MFEPHKQEYINLIADNKSEEFKVKLLENPNDLDEDLINSIMYRNRLDFLKILIIDLNILTTKNNLIYYIIDDCITYSNTTMMKFLLDNGMDPNYITCKNIGSYKVEDSVLAKSCSRGNLDMVKLLVEYGANPNSDDGCNLKLVCQNGYHSILKLLIEAGADIHFNDEKPLQFAIANRHPTIINLLLENGANMDVINKQLANEFNDCKEMELVNLLEENGADLKLLLAHVYKYK